ncbi:MAG: hypothetical protein JRI23_02740 [Deltaproteobacteria bacterium]|nr:hypothetical protein [Deltaproteobacteria bacterium]MBW2530422.1 hypothetical protein [Deltaproteobacteria bacterium]
MRVWVGFAVVSVGLLALTQCHLLTGDYETATGTTAGIGGGVGGGTTTSTTASGGAATALVSQDVVARYFFDDAAEGDMPQQAADSAPAPALPINIDYGETGSGGHPHGVSWTEQQGHRGLRWLWHDSGGRAETPISDTKLTDALASSTELTVELVTQLAGYVVDTRLLVIGDSSSGILNLRVHDESQLDLEHTINLSVIGLWQVALLERHVLHVVIDTTQDVEEDRVKLYSDGVLISNAGSAVIAHNELLNISAGDLMLGNDGNYNSIEGTIFYAAVYSRALTPAQVQNNAAILLVDDDRPE